MKFYIPALAAALVCCLSCVEINPDLGTNTLPVDETFQVYSKRIPIKDIMMRRADSLSGYSSTRMTFGSIRDTSFGLTKRGAAFTLVPMYDSLDFGTEPVVKQFRLSVASDSISIARQTDAHILQNVKVYELSRALDPLADYDCNMKIEHGPDRITKGTPVINGRDSMVFEFSKGFADKFLELGKDKSLMKDFNKFVKKFPGIYLETADPVGEGGRINMFKLQLGYDSNNSYLTGNLAKLVINSYYKEQDARIDTTFFFYLGANDFYNIDSLLTNSATGKFPEYCLNVTSSEDDALIGKAGSRMIVEGGGGVKPVIAARSLKETVQEQIRQALEETGIDPSKYKSAIINKASLILPFEFPDDYHIMFRYPQILSPTLRSWATKKRYDQETGDTVTYKVRAFGSITDSSTKTEDIGAINRNPEIMAYRPDVTYYLQTLLQDGTDAKIDEGAFDIWMIIQANEIITTINSGASDLSEYYQYLAYQSYYNNMYGSGGNDYYSNYYTYMMAAMYAGQSSTSTSISTQIDKERYYNAVLNGPVQDDDSTRVPELYIVFSIPAARLQ